MDQSFLLKGNICYSLDKNTIRYVKDGYLACVNGLSEGVYETLPDNCRDYEVKDFGDALIVPGLTDLHIHAPQYASRGIGMDLELLEWLDSYTFPEESKYDNIDYAEEAYSIFTRELKYGATTRACIFATMHVPATGLLMDKLETTGIKVMVGKVNMDRNSPDNLREADAPASEEATLCWLESMKGKYKNVQPILTPRFIPSCSDELMGKLKKIQQKYGLPIQSHLSESPGEVSWVKELCPWSASYGDAYDHFGLFGGDVRTIMAHCVHPTEQEFNLMKERGIFVAHCPQSNTNLSSGIAPVRAYLNEGLQAGLGSDVAGGTSASIFRAMADAIQVSKLRWRLKDERDKPLTVQEAFYLGTMGGGAFFGKVGSFLSGYEMDAVVIDDGRLKYPRRLTLEERLERYIYLSDDRDIISKYVTGKQVF